jgi:hypothetical protein
MVASEKMRFSTMGLPRWERRAWRAAAGEGKGIMSGAPLGW